LVPWSGAGTSPDVGHSTAPRNEASGGSSIPLAGCRSGDRGADYCGENRRHFATIPPMRYLIVNADDFGYTEDVNRGILDAHDNGIVTSASLMVDRPAAADAAARAQERPRLGVGLHVEAKRWRTSRFPRQGSARSADAVRRSAADDLRRQLDRFRLLVGRAPSHLDSHQHRHLAELVRPAFENAAAELGIPLRRLDPRVRFCGDFYGHDGRGQPDHEAINVDALIRLIKNVDGRVTELCCHPGYADSLDDWYRSEREQEVRALCDPRVRDAIEREGIRLCSFAEVDFELVGRSVL
jgi:chitin disaccharide deacetylase